MCGKWAPLLRNPRIWTPTFDRRIFVPCINTSISRRNYTLYIYSVTDMGRGHVTRRYPFARIVFITMEIRSCFLFLFLLEQHPAISECAVMGVPDKTYGEVLSAIVVVHENVAAEAAAKSKPALTLDTFKPWALERMAPYKVAKLSGVPSDFEIINH